MSYELIITEKPNAASKIAAALADGKPLKKNEKGVPYYDITHGNKDIIVACAVGHLYTLAEKEKKKGWTYPVFDIEWKESGKERKDAAFSKKYLSVIKKLSKGAKEFTIATDYDVEGEVIGLTIVKYACKQKDANRMKFSTLTKDELIRAYENKQKTLNWGQAYAGETRHFLDWMYGINLSRALSLSIKAARKMHKILSSGRVQGPALKILVDKEKEIQAFKPEPYWELDIEGEVKEGALTAQHNDNPFWEKNKAEEIKNKIEGKDKGVVKDVSKKDFQVKPPVPFDLTTLQTEAFRTLRIPPSYTLQLAQNLYLDGAISYPRTSSQQLPESIGYKKIMTDLMKNPLFEDECGKLLSGKKLVPNNGKKNDPAHPAIYPTGQMPSLRGREMPLYELIVRRFLSTFGDPAIRETMKIEIDVAEETFIAKGTRTKEKGWHELYGRFAMQKEEELPRTVKGEEVKIKKHNMYDKETQPPKRYTAASIIKELEKKGLGTKATRAGIVDALFQRGYAIDKPITATGLGIKTVETLQKYCPEILDEELTRKFEEEMEQIREGKKKEEEVLSEAKTVLKKTLKEFKEKEVKIGDELAEAMIETNKELSYIGKCPSCGGDLVQKKGKFGIFIACDNYPDCKQTFKLPQRVKVESAKKECEECKHPKIFVGTGKKRQEVCINPDCKSKQIEDKKDREEAKKIENGEVEKPCPTCGKGHLVLRKSVYGQFYGCSEYPKCKYTGSVDGDNSGKKFPKKGSKKTTKRWTKKKGAKKKSSKK